MIKTRLNRLGREREAAQPHPPRLQHFNDDFLLRRGARHERRAEDKSIIIKRNRGCLL